MRTDAERLAFLRAWNPNQLNIERNPHNMNYQTVEQWLAEMAGGDNPWCEVLYGEREKILATGSLWTLQVYPDTPIGFYAAAASSLEALIDWAMATA